MYNVSEPKVSLRLSEQRNLFKLFSNDVGLLAAQYSDGVQLRILQGDSGINYGAIYENAVAQELVSHNQNVYYYNSKKMGELDFLISLSGHPVPIEVKSGKDYNIHRALLSILQCKDYDIPEGYVLCNSNFNRKGNIIYCPVYMAMMLKPADNIPQYYRVELSGL